MNRRLLLLLSLVLGLAGLVPARLFAAPAEPQQPAEGNVQWDQPYHNTRLNFYRTPFGAVPTGQAITLRLRAAKGNLDNATLVVYNIDPSTDSDGTADGTYWQVVTTPSSSDDSYDYYTFVVPAQPTTRTLYYKFRLQDEADCDWYVDDYAHNSYDHEDRSENGKGMMVNGKSGDPCASSDGYENNSFDITVYDAGFTMPSWAQNAVIYQILPDRFRNGDPSNDDAWPYDDVYGTQVHQHTTWNESPDNPRDASSSYYQHWSADFFGGDLQGIIDKLDYLHGLGVTALYLNPIFASPSNHGYDTSNYLQINPRYGTLETFQTLASEAHKRGMKLILDGVFNHTGSDSVYFDRYHRWNANGNPLTTTDSSGACEAAASAYADFYNLYGDTGPCYDNHTYDSWWGYDTLPLLNENASVKDFIFDFNNDDPSPSAVIQYWYDQGVDGWRFDVADELSHDFWREFRAQVKGNDTLTGPLYSEVWYEATPWLYGDQMDATMNYRYRKAVLGFLVDTDWTDNDNNGDSTIFALPPSQFDYVLGSIREDYPAPAWYAMMNLMGSHDTNRALYVLRQRSTDLGSALAKMKMMAELQFTYPGAPTIYYGDEVGLGAIDWGGESQWGAGYTDNGTAQDDPYNRHPYPWTDESGVLPSSGGYTLPVASLRETYRILGLTRASYDVLRTGDVSTLLADDATYTYAYARTDANGAPSCALAIFNRATVPHTVTLSLPTVCSNTTYYDVLNKDKPYTTTGTNLAPVPLAALSGAVLVPAFDNPNTTDSTASLPPAEVDVLAATSDLSSGGQTVISATLRDASGELLPAGITVDFALLDGDGSLSGATATTNADGVAVITYTAPSSTTVAVIQAAITAPSGVRYQAGTTIYAGYQADISEAHTTQTDIGPQTFSLPGVFTVTKEGVGTPIVTLAKFSNMPNAQNAASEYVDVHLTAITDVTGLTITLPYVDSGAEDLPTIYWWHTGNWTPVSGTVTWDTNHKLVSFHVITDSIPSLSQLNGTPFVAAYEANEPTALHIVHTRAARVPMAWGGMLSLLLGAAILYRKRTRP